MVMVDSVNKTHVLNGTILLLKAGRISSHSLVLNKCMGF